MLVAHTKTLKKHPNRTPIRALIVFLNLFCILSSRKNRPFRTKTQSHSISPQDIPFIMTPAYATSSTTPPASLIFRSASRLKYLARTTMGMLGRRPLPRTLEYPRGSRSMTGAVSVFCPLR